MPSTRYDAVVDALEVTFDLRAPDPTPYEARVRTLEAEGMTRSDAQGVADAEILKARRAARPTPKQQALDLN